jgi:hypothetical protein
MSSLLETGYASCFSVWLFCSKGMGLHPQLLAPLVNPNIYGPGFGGPAPTLRAPTAPSTAANAKVAVPPKPVGVHLGHWQTLPQPQNPHISHHHYLPCRLLNQVLPRQLLPRRPPPSLQRVRVQAQPPRQSHPVLCLTLPRSLSPPSP